MLTKPNFQLDGGLEANLEQVATAYILVMKVCEATRRNRSEELDEREADVYCLAQLDVAAMVLRGVVDAFGESPLSAMLDEAFRVGVGGSGK